MKLKHLLVAIALALPIGIAGLFVVGSRVNTTLQTVGNSPVSKLGSVTDVVDGTRLIVFINGDEDEVELCGVTAPNRTQAEKALETLVQGKEIILSEVERNPSGRMVAEVFVSASTPEQPNQELFVNGELIAAGVAYYDRASGDRCPNGPQVLASAESEPGQSV